MKKLLFTTIWISLVLLASAHVPGAEVPNARAVRNFSRVYRDASNAEWRSLENGGYVCRFVQNGVTKRAFYDDRGRWIITIASYTPDFLPAAVWRQIHSVYYDYSILYVNEISVSGRPLAYLVQVQDKRSIKIVRVVDDEMEEVKEIETL